MSLKSYKSSKISKSFKPESYKKLKRFFSLEKLPEIESEEESDCSEVIISCENSKSVPDLEYISNPVNHPNCSNMNAANTSANNPVITPIDVFNSLRVPDAIKDLPKFDGNPRLLFEFLNNVEEIRSLISCTEGTPYGQLLLRAIRNKIEGPANEVLNMYGTPLVWTQIKQNLILHYSDKRNETSLIRDLHGIKQSNKPVERFYSEIIEILATMTNHVQIHESDKNVIQSKRNLYTEMCLNAFLAGLKEPLGSTIRAMKPDTLATAFSYCMKEQNISYSRYEPSTQKLPQNSRPNNASLASTRSPYQNIHIPKTSPHAWYNTIPQPGFVPALYNRAPNPFHYPPYQFRHVNSNFNNSASVPNSAQYRMHQQFQNNRFNQSSHQGNNPLTTVTGNKNLPKPEPMDIGSTNTRQTRYQTSQQNLSTQNNLFRPSALPKFTSKELFNVSSTTESNQCENPNYQQLDQYYECENTDQTYNYDTDYTNYNQYENQHEQNLDYEIDDSNFHQTASQNQSDT